MAVIAIKIVPYIPFKYIPYFILEQKYILQILM